MEQRTLGKTGLRVSVLGFGCGNVGGLMVRGAPAERERAVARAIELGINYFDTAPSYGDGLSERHLGQTLRALKATVYVGTKFRVEPGELADAGGAIARSLEASLTRLGLERVDLFQLHNLVGASPTAAQVLDAVVPALERLRGHGKIRFYGITALGETAALHRVIDAGVLDTAQVCYNLLNPSAGVAVPAGFPAQDFGRLLDRVRRRQVGAIVIRVLAAGALSGDMARHPVAVPVVGPGRWRSSCGRATPGAWSRPPSASRSPRTPCRPCCSATRASSTSSSPRPRWPRDRCPRPPTAGWPACGATSPPTRGALRREDRA